MLARRKAHFLLSSFDLIFVLTMGYASESLDEAGVEAEDIDTILQLVGGLAGEVIEA